VWLRWWVLAVVWSGCFGHPPDCGAQDPPPSLPSLDRAAEQALRQRDAPRVQELVQQMRAIQSDDVGIELAAGQLLYRAGLIEPSIESFERFVQARPGERPYLWQLGIAYYDAGRFREGAELFEEHRRVNPNDVENALYHWLCIAAEHGVEQATERMLPAPGDTRIPMHEVYQLYAGTGSVEKVLGAVERLAADDPKRVDAMLSANLYIGLWDHAHGRTDDARERFRTAADTPRTYYMADVARVWAERYAKQP
jgi:tetratricopeptide (TPR) repeat protein